MVVPAYLAAGMPAIKILVTRSPGITWDTMYQLFWRPVLGYTQFSVSSLPPHLELSRTCCSPPSRCSPCCAFPTGYPPCPRCARPWRCLAWLFFTAFQRPWYA